MTNSTRTPLSSSRTSPGRRSSAASSSASGRRRTLLAVGPYVPVLFIIATIAVSSTLGQPLQAPIDGAALLGWMGFTAVLIIPFLASFVVMLTSRRGGLVWSTTLVFSLVAGLLGLGVDVSVLNSESSTAALGLVSIVVIQAVLLAPIAATVAFIVNIVRQRGRDHDGRDQRV